MGVLLIRTKMLDCSVFVYVFFCLQKNHCISLIFEQTINNNKQNRKHNNNYRINLEKK